MSPDPASNPGLAARLRARRNEHRGTTSGLAPGYVQANLVVLPADYADEFREFCARNAAACPVLAVSRPGDPRLPELGCELCYFRRATMPQDQPILVLNPTPTPSPDRRKSQGA
jgi:uncharacterized protein YcsI (UPF0317 family)